VKIRYVLDAHAPVWSVLSPEKLSAKATQVIKAAGPYPDPFDRLIVAEALVPGVPLITKDGNITDSAVGGWCGELGQRAVTGRIGGVTQRARSFGGEFTELDPGGLVFRAAEFFGGRIAMSASSWLARS
jgi:hypothetical protein